MANRSLRFVCGVVAVDFSVDVSLAVSHLFFVVCDVRVAPCLEKDLCLIRGRKNSPILYRFRDDHIRIFDGGKYA